MDKTHGNSTPGGSPVVLKKSTLQGGRLHGFWGGGGAQPLFDKRKEKEVTRNNLTSKTLDGVKQSGHNILTPSILRSNSISGTFPIQKDRLVRSDSESGDDKIPA